MVDISIVFLTFSIHRREGRSLQGTVISVWDLKKKFFQTMLIAELPPKSL